MKALITDILSLWHCWSLFTTTELFSVLLTPPVWRGDSFHFDKIFLLEEALLRISYGCFTSVFKSNWITFPQISWVVHGSSFKHNNDFVKNSIFKKLNCLIIIIKVPKLMPHSVLEFRSSLYFSKSQINGLVLRPGLGTDDEEWMMYVILLYL